MAPAKPAKLREAIANTLRDVKAYDLPAMCVRLGLAAGDESEAFASKYTYVHKRLMALDRAELQRVGAQVLEEFDAPELEKCLDAVALQSGSTVSPLIRRRILELLQYVRLQGELGNDIELLQPVFPLERMPSVYPEPRRPEKTLADDIWQHRERNDDWDNAELLTFIGILTCSQIQFFQLLERLVDPSIRDESAQKELVGSLNTVLRRDAYELTVVRRISGYPVYEVRPYRGDGQTPADGELSEHFRQLTNADVDRIWEKALERRLTDPEGAITSARTLLERACKYILDEVGIEHSETQLPKLWALTAEQLNLAPSQHTEPAFKAILGNCQNVVNTIGEIRNKIGDSHGQKGRPVRPQRRHAELVVNLAGAMAKFLVTTWQDRKAAPLASDEKSQRSAS